MKFWEIPVIGKFRVPDTYPLILRFTEKHGDFSFICNNEEDLAKAALKVLTDRMRQGYWYHEPENPSLLPPAYTNESAQTLVGLAKDAALKEIKAYKRALKEYESEREEWELINRAIAESNGKLALYVLEVRKDAEYEQFEYVYPQYLG